MAENVREYRTVKITAKFPPSTIKKLDELATRLNIKGRNPRTTTEKVEATIDKLHDYYFKSLPLFP